MPNINFLYCKQCWQSNLQCAETLYHNSIPEWWQQQSCASL